MKKNNYTELLGESCNKFYIQNGPQKPPKQQNRIFPNFHGSTIENPKHPTTPKSNNFGF